MANISNIDFIKIGIDQNGVVHYVNASGAWDILPLGGSGDCCTEGTPFVGFDVIDIVPRPIDGKVNFGITTSGNLATRTAAGVQKEISVDNSIKSKTFNLNATEISTNLPMMLELDASKNCIISSVIFDYKVNGGTGIDYGGFGVIRLANSFSFSGTTTNAYQQLQTSNNISISNQYQLTIDPFISVDPLTTLDITIYYFITP
jgi:hypothetical protein